MKHLTAFAIIVALIAGLGITAGAPGATPFYPLSPADRDLIERVVMAEARGECFKGIKAVAQVILHRLQSPAWPETASQVVRSEFAKPWEGCVSRAIKQAVHEVFDRGLMAIEQEVFYFMNPRTASRRGAAWQYSNTKLVTTIGSHQFRR